jgi:hypothetical protein
MSVKVVLKQSESQLFACHCLHRIRVSTRTRLVIVEANQFGDVEGDSRHVCLGEV